ncbi:MAG: PQQ-binding-like beta-propeller repeat protein [Vicinamibacterales bacterium]
MRPSSLLLTAITALALPASQAEPAFDPGRAPLWHVPGAARGTPAFDGTTAYFLSRDREVVAIDAARGTVRWRAGTGVTSTDDIFGATTAGTRLTLAGPLVVGGDWDVVAFDRASGERRWTYTAPAGDGPGLFLGPAAGDTVFAGSPGGHVYALDTRSGRPRWITTIEDRDPASVFPPVLHGDLVVVGFSVYVNPSVGGLAALDAATGRLRWRTMFPPARERWQHTNVAGGPIVVDDVVIGSAGDSNLYAVDLATGALRWTFPALTDLPEQIPGVPPLSTDFDHRAIVLAGRLLVAGSATGVVVAYDLDTRRERWRFYDRAAGSTMFWFAADDRLVYVPYFGGFVVALDVATGVERWRTGDFTKGFIWPPLPAGDRLFLGGAYAGFQALSLIAPETP